jgi:hypothetical protein
MKATLLVSRRTVVAQGVFIETVPWQVPARYGAATFHTSIGLRS